MAEDKQSKLFKWMEKKSRQKVFFEKNHFRLFVCCYCFLFTFPVYEEFILLLTIVPALSSTALSPTLFESLKSNTSSVKVKNNLSYSELQKDISLSKESSSLDSSSIQTGAVHCSSRR